jgi:uncharacterized protein YecE (DUF72 family)
VSSGNAPGPSVVPRPGDLNAVKDRTQKKGRLYAGTSGWSYPWDAFYPADLPSREYLAHYSRQFRTVEVNYSFYHLPRLSAYENWAAQTPRYFVFSVKLSRFITHIKRLSGVKAELEKFLANASVLGPKFGPILVQLPPSLKADASRLDEFLTSAEDARREIGMEQRLRMAIEFRHRSWFELPEMNDVLKILEKHGSAFVFAHSSRYPYPESEPATSDFVYLRFHGPDKMFASFYGKEMLTRWALGVNRWIKQGLDVYAYFNNDMKGYAVEDARELINLAGSP